VGTAHVTASSATQAITKHSAHPDGCLLELGKNSDALSVLLNLWNDYWPFIYTYDREELHPLLTQFMSVKFVYPPIHFTSADYRVQGV
jgi:hypothetical protein